MIRNFVLGAMLTCAGTSLLAHPSMPTSPTTVTTSLPRHDAHLSTMRAGYAVAPATVTAGERATLRAASERAPHLADMRAGELSDRDWQIIGFTALAIVLLILIF